MRVGGIAHKDSILSCKMQSVGKIIEKKSFLKIVELRCHDESISCLESNAECVHNLTSLPIVCYLFVPSYYTRFYRFILLDHHSLAGYMTIQRESGTS